MKEKLEELLNKITNNKYDFKYKSAVLDSGNEELDIEIIYKDGVILDNSDKQKCLSCVADYLDGYKYKVTFIKNYVSKEEILAFVKDYFKQNYVSIVYKIKSLEHGEQYVLTLSIAKEQQEYVVSQKIVQKTMQALLDRFSTAIKINAEFLPNMMSLKEEKPAEIKIEEKIIETKNRQILVGELIEENSTYIRDSQHENQVVTICGYISDLKRYWTKPNIPDGANAKQILDHFKTEVPDEERLMAGQKPYYRFKLTDFTGDITVSIFPKKQDREKLQNLHNDDFVTVNGTIIFDNFLGAFLKAKSINTCDIPPVWEEKIEYKTESANYQYVFPQTMTYTNQVGLFSMFDEPTVAPFLKDNQIVVFDFETTGLKAYEGDKIVEIGAVKVINGAIVESFRTLVNPDRHIPFDASAVHGIYDKDVVDAPKSAQALQDFYKFTRGCLLVGYNVDFDYSFLVKEGKLAGYNFDNKTFDCLALARDKVRGLKNYKLKTIAKELGVSLDNAHSALFDTIATAEVLIKLADKI